MSSGVSGLELKYLGTQELRVTGGVTGSAAGDGEGISDGISVEGYASVFGRPDHGGDIVRTGAFGASLARLSARGERVRMLWQHDPARPIGVWDEIREDSHGLWVKGRLLGGITQAREAAALLEAGAIDGLSIGYRTVSAERDAKGRRLLTEVELWEVSLVTFPMLPDARIGRKSWEFALSAALRAGAEALRRG